MALETYHNVVSVDRANVHFCPLQPGRYCQGRLCMGWRWRMEQHEVREVCGAPYPKVWRRSDHGYCGMVPQEQED